MKYSLDFFQGEKVKILYMDCNKMIIEFAKKKFVIDFLYGYTEEITEDKLKVMFLTA